jgi:hypothetical protein
LAGNIQAPLGEEVFGIPEAQRKPELMPSGVLDD